MASATGCVVKMSETLCAGLPTDSDAAVCSAAKASASALGTSGVSLPNSCWTSSTVIASGAAAVAVLLTVGADELADSEPTDVGVAGDAGVVGSFCSGGPASAPLNSSLTAAWAWIAAVQPSDSPGNGVTALPARGSCDREPACAPVAEVSVAVSGGDQTDGAVWVTLALTEEDTSSVAVAEQAVTEHVVIRSAAAPAISVRAVPIKSRRTWRRCICSSAPLHR